MKNIRTPTVVGLIKAEIEANKELPDISSADAGKLATVDSNGKWTAANLTVGQGEVAVDSTLLVSGAAADAKVTGDKLGELKSALGATVPAAMTNGYYVNNNDGKVYNNSAYAYCDYIKIIPGGNVKLSHVAVYSSQGISFYDVNKAFLSSYTGSTGGNITIETTAPNNAYYLRATALSGNTISFETLDIYSNHVKPLEDWKDVADTIITANRNAINFNYDGLESFLTHGTFAVGGLNTNGTLKPSETTRVSSANLEKLSFDHDITVNVKSGYTWGYIPFTGSTPGSWSGWKTASFTIPANTEFVVQIRRNPEGTAIANIVEFVSALTFASTVSAPYYSIPSAMTSTKVFSEISEESRACQGSCTDGTYLYVAYIDDSTTTELLKIDMSDWTVSERVEGNWGHMNDLYYNSTTDEVWSIYNTSAAYNTMIKFKASDLSVVDTVDLASVVHSIDASANFTGITYLSDYARYVFAVAVSSTLIGFAFLKPDFTLEKFVKINQSSRTTQNIDLYNGMIVETDYNPGNRINFFDYHGNRIGYVAVSDGTELESFSSIGGKIYLVYNTSSNKELAVYEYTITALTKVAKADVLSQYNPN